jgi:DNA-binding IclR family transcriptional regulator
VTAPTKPEGQQAVRRVLRLIWILQGNTFHGLRLKQIADTAKQLPGTTLRDLEVLAEEGIAERIPGRDDCWRLTPRLVQLAVAHHHEMAAVQARLDETLQRYSRKPT